MNDARIPFIDALMSLAEEDERIALIVPDVGFKHADRFKERFPDRYYNFGITECSTVLIAAGMALDGMKPWVYSMRNFVLYRPYEMVRNGLMMHNANVKLVGVSGAGNYGFLGGSHNDLYEGEHIQAAKTLRLRISLPNTENEVIQTVKDEYEKQSPAYICL